MSAPIFSPLARCFALDGECLHVMVDLSVLHPEGENGGLKPFLLETLHWLCNQNEVPLRFTYLVAPKFHSQLKPIQRHQDRIISIRRSGRPLAELPGTWRTNDHLLWPPPVDLALHIRADVVYAPMISMEFACPGIPTVGFVADLLHRDYPDSCSSDELRRRERHFDEIVRLSNRIQCISAFGMSQLHAHYRVSRGRAFFTHIAIHNRLQDASREPVPSTLPQRPFFFYPANAWPHKNHDGLLAAYHAFRKAAPEADWDLVLTGNQDDRMDRIVRMANSLSLSGHVHYLGYLSSGQLSHVWRRAGALVFPSRYEGFGIPPTEAMHYGIPIISSRDASLPEVIGNAALYFDADKPGEFSEALAQVASSAALRSELVSRGKKRLSAFSIEAESAKLLAALRATAAEPAVPFWRGATDDGRLAGKFLVGLPARNARSAIEIEVEATRPSRLRVYQDLEPLGGHSIDTGTAAPIRVEVSAHARTLGLESVGGDLRLRRISLVPGSDLPVARDLFSLPE